MADIALTATQIGLVWPDDQEVYAWEAAVTITAGQAVYINSNGKLDLADANGSGTLQFAGIALNGGGAGQTIDVIKRGALYGFTISGLAYFAPVYLSNTAGSLADAAGTSSNVVGRVIPLNNTGTLTKVLWVNAQWSTVFS